jgi:hypothetical protein
MVDPHRVDLERKTEEPISMHNTSILDVGLLLHARD